MVSIEQIQTLSPDKIVISPGPGKPEDAGISISAIEKYYKQIPILGICLGHQAIAVAFGGKVVNSNEISHGKIVEINHSKSKIFKDIPNNFHATRYHSLMIDKNSLSKEINIIAKGSSFDLNKLKELNGPIFLVSFWNAIEINKLRKTYWKTKS